MADDKNSATKVHGACFCGKVHYEADFPTLWVAHCHCENCRRAQGAGVVTYAGFKSEQVRFTAGEQQLVSYLDPSTKAVRRFCGTCGSTISFEAPRWKGEVHLMVANLTTPLDRLPHVHAYADRAPDWCPVTDDLRQLGGETGSQEL